MKINIKEMAVFSMFGTLMYVSKIIMEAFPNIHLLGVFTIALTVVYGKKALYPIYTYVFLNGLLSGFSVWWVPYLYIWGILWAVVMIIRKKFPQKWMPAICMVICGIHGFLFGTLYAPAQAIMFGLDFEGMVAWIIAGIPFDIIHGIGNLVCGILIMPMVSVIRKMEKSIKYS